MTPDSSVLRSRLKMALSYALITMIFLGLSVVRCRSLVHEGDVCFGDARVYARAIAVFQKGGNPYLANAGVLPFVYPPWFLRFASWIGSLLPKQAGWFLYLVVASLGILSIPGVIATFYVSSKWLTPLVAMVMFTFQPRFVEELMLLSGNIANLFYGLILLAGVPGVRRNRWSLYYVALTFAAIVKPPFLLFLTLPLLAGAKQGLRSLCCVFCVLSGYLLQRLSAPTAYGDFQRGVYRQIIQNQDTGYGLYNYVAKCGRIFAIMRTSNGVMGGYFIIIVALFLGLLLFRKYKSRPAVERLWVPVLIVAAVLANPRMQRYDSDVAIIPAVYICVECLCTAGSRQKGAWVAILLTLFAAVFTKAEMGTCLVLITAILLVIFRLADEHSSGRLFERLLLS